MANVGSRGLGRGAGMACLAIVFHVVASAGFPTVCLGQAVPRASTKVYFDTSHRADADLRSTTIMPRRAITPRRSRSTSG